MRLQAFADLSETIWHQGTVYPASAAAVPFLFELLTYPGVHDPGWAASLLGCIATGEGWLQYGLRVDGEQTLRRRLARQGRSLEDGAGGGASGDGGDPPRRLGGAGTPTPLLERPGGSGAPSVAETLGLFPEHVSWSVPAIDAALASEPDEHVRKVLAESKARLTYR